MITTTILRYRLIRKLYLFKFYILQNDFEAIITSPPQSDPNNEYLAIDKFITLKKNKITIKAGFSWDGASGISIDTDPFIKSSLVHDALYHLIRQGLLSKTHRKWADDVMYEINIAEGMNKFRAWYTWAAVRIFGFMAINRKVEIKTVK